MRPGHRTITTQLYFGRRANGSTATWRKPPSAELILDPKDQGDGTNAATYDFALERDETTAAA